MKVRGEDSLNDSLHIVSLTPQNILSSFCLKSAYIVDIINTLDNKLI